MLVNSLPNENGLLVALPPAVRDRLRPSLKRVRLEAGSTLYDISSTSDHTWFITSGIVRWLKREICASCHCVHYRSRRRFRTLFLIGRPFDSALAVNEARAPLGILFFGITFSSKKLCSKVPPGPGYRDCDGLKRHWGDVKTTCSLNRWGVYVRRRRLL